LKYLIVGGTGTLGTCLVEKLEGHDLVVFSRDELKQQDMKKRFPAVRYVIGDIRDKQSLRGVMHGVDAVFHVAALKHVDVLEHNAGEAIKTNILGTINVAEAAMESGVKHVVFSSTDKAVLPVNVYGMSKGISERYLLNQVFGVPLGKRRREPRLSHSRLCPVAQRMRRRQDHRCQNDPFLDSH
jgi:FlaA1/EpsC-like NDP-sugar epimerase